MGGHCLPGRPVLSGLARARVRHAASSSSSSPASSTSRCPTTASRSSSGPSTSSGLRGARGADRAAGRQLQAGVGDVRESPALKIIELLRELGADVVYHDPLVAELHAARAALAGARRRARGRRPRADRHGACAASTTTQLARGRCRGCSTCGASRAPRAERAFAYERAVARGRRPRLLGTEPRAQRGRSCPGVAPRPGAATAIPRPASRSRRCFARARFSDSLERGARGPRARRGAARDTGRARTPSWRSAVLEAGKHCFVEKPLAQSVADAAARPATRPARAGGC